MELSKALKRFREEYSLNQKQVADAANVHLRLYQKYESGESSPSASTIIEIVKHFKVSANFLLGVEDYDEPDEIDENNKFNEFDEEECKLISVHNALDSENRRTLMDMADFLCNRQGLYPITGIAYPTHLRKIPHLTTANI